MRVTLAMLLLCGCSQRANVPLGGVPLGGDPGAAAASSQTASPVEPIEISFDWRRDAFDADPIPTPPTVFGLMLGDLDLDGDLDLVLNRHHRARMEVFENERGAFSQINRRGHDTTGIYDNRGVPDLYAEKQEMEDRIRQRGIPGVYVWHDLNPVSRWQVRVEPDGDSDALSLRLTTNRRIITTGGLGVREFEKVDRFTLEVELEDATAARTFSLKNAGTATQLRVEVLTPDPPTIFAGAECSAFAGGQISLWKNDPHGMTLVDRVGSRHPDLFVTRGGLRGELLPPHDPKTDKLYEQVRGETLFREVEPGVLPAGYGRGRQVAWVDVDADGELELYMANTLSPNSLYEQDGSGAFVDVAPAWGLDLVEPESFAWLDVDGDGALDVVVVDGTGIQVGMQRGGKFEFGPGDDLGLTLPRSEDVDPRPGQLFAPVTLQIFDVDRDGDLDLCVSRHDSSDAARLFRREGEGFVDVTQSMGLASERGLRALLLADVDNDGWIDLVTSGDTLRWWRNLAGRRFEPRRLDSGAEGSVSEHVAAGDVDGDGWIDLVMVTEAERLLLRNRSTGPNRALEVTPELPLGTVIRAYASDGSVLAQQWGAATVSRYSQSLQPLRFGMAPGVEVIELGIQLPGDRRERRRVPVAPGTVRQVL